MTLTDIAWAIGGRIPRRLADALARAMSYPLALLPLPAVAAWATTVRQATGVQPRWGLRRLLLENWLRNTAWSLRLARWSDEEVLRVVDISERDLARLRDSLTERGLIVALPHMGSWDCAGAFCTRVGIKVVSVAERLPKGLFEKFRSARQAMGMDIYPMDQPDLMDHLARDVHSRRLVCLLGDRDLSRRGVKVAWHGRGTVSVPAGPAVLAERTGADLRVVTTAFEGPRLRIRVSERIEGTSVEERLTRAVAEFAAAINEDPASWLMLRQVFV